MSEVKAGSPGFVKLDYTETQIAELLDKTQLSNEFEWAELLELGRFMKPRRVRSGRAVFVEGEVDQSLGILIEGAVEILKTDARNPRKNKIAALKPPQTFGEMSLIDNEPRSATAVADGDCVILFLSKADLEKIVEQNPPLACKVFREIAKMLSRRLRMTSGKLVEFISK